MNQANPPLAGRLHRVPPVRDDSRAAWGMITPALSGLLGFIAVPFVIAIILSFTDMRMGSPLPTRIVGLEQYRRIFDDGGFRRALINNAVFAAAVVPVQTGLALVMALLLHQTRRGATLLRTLFFLPVVFPMALVAVIWTLIYAPGPEGPLNALLGCVTLGAWNPQNFLHDGKWALPAIMLTSIWQGSGFQMIILLAGLQGIPRELHEAATIDGAGALGRFRFVTLPQLRNTLLFVILITSILAFRLFDQVQIMTRGGPHDTTTTVVYEAVQATFVRQQVARGAAMTVIFFLIVLALTITQRRLLRQEREVA